MLASTDYTFPEVEQGTKAIFPWGVSHSTVHNLSGKVADFHIAEEEKEVSALFEDGVIPETKGKVVPHLLIEADGVSVPLQIEEERRAEIKVGIAQKGWQEISKRRHRLKEKSVYSGIMKGDRFWEGFSLILAKKYDLSQRDKVIVTGDGASWVTEGAELLGDLDELDRFHLKKALRQGVPSDRLAAEVYEACTSGDISKVYRLLIEAQGKADADRSKEVMKLTGYPVGELLWVKGLSASGGW